MKTLACGITQQFVRRAMLAICCGMLVTGAAQAQAQGRIHVDPRTAMESRGLLTNERIVQMMKQGEPDAAIIAAIQANPVEFDLSRQQMLALHREGVSRQVLNAMVTAEQRRRKGFSRSAGANAREPSPQPYPPKSRVNSAGQANEVELSPQPYPPKNGMLLTPGAQHTMLGTRANSPFGDGSKSALLPAAQQPAIAGGAMGDGSVRRAVSTGTAAPGTIGLVQTTSAPGNAISTAGPASVPVKGSGRTKYESMTLQKGVTPDKTFSTWANSAQGPGMGSPSDSRANPAINAGGPAAQSKTAMVQEPSQGTAGPGQTTASGKVLAPPVVLYPPRGTPCGKGYSCQSSGNLDLGPTEAQEMATAGHQFTLLGCSFGKGFDSAASNVLGITNLQPTLPMSAKSSRRVYIQQNRMNTTSSLNPGVTTPLLLLRLTFCTRCSTAATLSS